MDNNFINFYPTPESLLREITKKISFWKMSAILEPEAGKGDIVDYIKKCGGSPHIDCIEINPELQAALRGKDYPVIADDFLSFVPQYRYDLVIMNPPFDAGAKHLLKALDVQKNGGQIICILNAETLKNPYSLERKQLLNKLQSLDASTEYRSCEFSSAERSTNVEIAVVDVTIPEKEGYSFIMDNLKSKVYKDELEKEVTDVVDRDFISAVVLHYNMEIDAGLALMKEYKALVPYIMESTQKIEYNKPILNMFIGEKGNLSEVEYVRMVRNKYWTALFNDIRFTGPMTSDMYDSYSNKVKELVNYEFTVANIKELQIQMCGNLVEGIEKTILDLFDTLSYTYSYFSELDTNIHYYNGWCTNKAWYVNKKVILPVRAWNYIWKKMQVADWDIRKKFADIEKAFNYLAGCPGADVNIFQLLKEAEQMEQTKNISCKYFDLTFYKKGTVHITFKDMDLLKKLNIAGGKGKNMLPLAYGKKHYYEMTPEEQKVVDEFDGDAANYENVMANPDKYLLEITPEIMQIAG